MAEAEFFKGLVERNPREIPLRFGDEVDVDAFQAFVSAATNLEHLEVAWKNHLAERTLRALVAAAGASPASRLTYIKLHDDRRPIETGGFDFVGLLVRLARRDPKRAVLTVSLGHNNRGESWWLTLQNKREQTLDLNDLMFPTVRAYETFLADVLDAAADDGVFQLDLYLCRMAKYLTYAGVKRIFETIGTKYHSLRQLSLKMTPQDNDYCRGEEDSDDSEDSEDRGTRKKECRTLPYEVVISAVADAIGNCPEIEEVDIELGRLTKEHESASKKLADAILNSKT